MFSCLHETMTRSPLLPFQKFHLSIFAVSLCITVDVWHSSQLKLLWKEILLMDLGIKFRLQISIIPLPSRFSGTWLEKGSKRHNQSWLWQRSRSVFRHLAAISDDETLMKVGQIRICFLNPSHLARSCAAAPAVGTPDAAFSTRKWTGHHLAAISSNSSPDCFSHWLCKLNAAIKHSGSQS